MAEKVTLDDVGNFLAGAAVNTVNGNSRILEDEFDKVVYRDGSLSMSGNLDMNSNKLINLPDGETDSQAATVRQLRQIPKGDTGDRGPQGYSAGTLEQLKAAPVTDSPLNYDQAVFSFEEGDYTGKSDDINIIKSDYVDLSEGAWERQRASSIQDRDGNTVQAKFNTLAAIRVAITDYGASGASDCLAAFNAALTAVKAAGGGVIVFPMQGLGGWNLSDTAEIDASDITIELFDDVNLTKTTAARAFSFEGTDAAPLVNVGIRCPARKCKVDGNGPNMTGYTYDAGGTLYPAISFDYCDRPFAINVHVDRGLVNSLCFQFCRDPRVEECIGSNAVYDNGITFNFFLHYSLYDADDPTTWLNGKITRCIAYGNRGNGMANYAGVGCTIDSSRTYGNGNQTADAGFSPRGGGVSVESNADHPTRDSHTTITALKSVADNNSGLTVTAPGVLLVKPDIRGTLLPAGNPDALGIYGSNLIVLGTGDVTMTGGSFQAAAKHGAVMLATNGNFPSLVFDGEISSPSGRGIYGHGIASLSVSPNSLIYGAGDYGVNVDNSGGTSYNQGAGDVEISGKIEGNYSLPVSVDYVGNVRGIAVRMVNNRTGVGVGSHFRVRNSGTATINGVINRDTNGNTLAIVEIANTVTYGTAINVSGDSVSPQLAVSNLAANQGFTFAQDVGYDLLLQEVTAVGTGGGAAVAGRNTRPLGTTSFNYKGLATSIAGGAFTLPAGTYRVWARAPGYKVDQHKLYLRNVTDNADIAAGSNAYAPASSSIQTDSVIDTRVVLTAAKSLRLEHHCATANATDGLGISGSTQAGLFAELRVRKIA